MLGCSSARAALYSCSKRLRRTGLRVRCGGAILIATIWLLARSRARYTVPIPPSAIFSTRSYLPTVCRIGLVASVIAEVSAPNDQQDRSLGEGVRATVC